MVEIEQKKIEQKWQKIWEENKIFEPEVDNSKEKFFITVPYPYGNSAVHIGHGRTNTTTDIIARYHRLKGKNVLFPMAYHVSGSPVLAVSDSIARGDEKQIKITREAISDYVKDKNEQDKLIEKFKDPYEIAKFFSGTIENSFKSIGLSIDWSRDFTTGDEIYNKFIEWQYQKLDELGILVQGKYPILYSPSDKNAVGEDDIKDGDTDKVSVQDMTYILFKLKDENKFLPATTLRPDALFGTTNMWVNPEIDLCEVRVGEKVWIIAKNAVVKLEHQYDDVEVIGDYDGNSLIGKTATTPLIDREIPIASASFIDKSQGTGVVYSSPAGAPHDFMALVEAKSEGRLSKDVEVINTVETKDKKGNIIEYDGSCPAEDKINKFGVESSEDNDKLEQAKQELYKEEHYGGKLNEKAGEFTGLPIKFAKDKVKAKLEELGLGGAFYETSRRAVTRANDPVIVANLEGQWFLDYSKSETKEKAHKLLDTLEYNPPRLKATQKGYIDWVEMRPCARRRGLGTPLPFDREWVIEPLSDSTIYQMFYLVVGIIKREGIEPSNLEPIVFDYVMLGRGNLNMIAEESVIDKKIIEEMRQQVEYWKSFDLRYTAPPHMSNHLSFLIYHYALIFEKEYWPKGITIGGLMIKDGAKISKSKGNGIPLIRVKDMYGVDLYRLYTALASNYDAEMDFKDNEIMQLEKKFDRWKELLSSSLNRPALEYDEFTTTNKWLISKFYSRTKEYFEMFDNLRMREAYVTILYEFLNDINYHERRTSYEETLDVIRFIAKDYIILMTPVIAHICEELFEKGEFGEYASLAAFETDIDKYIDKKSENIEGIIENLIANISRTKESRNLEKIEKITIVQAADNKFELFDTLSELLSETKEFKTIFPKLMEKFPQDKKFIQKFVPKTLGSGLDSYLSKDKERELIEENKAFIEEMFNCTIEIAPAEDVEINSANIIPAKPSVILE